MAELSEVKNRVAKKIEEVMHRTYDPHVIAGAIIPLAMTWDEPTVEEVNAIFDTPPADASYLGIIREFVRRRRNAAGDVPTTTIRRLTA